MFESIRHLVDATLASPNALWLAIGIAIYLIASLATKASNLLSLAVRIAAFALLIWALADPVQQETTEKQELVALVDMSRSVQDRARRAGIDALTTYLENSDTTLRVFPFGRRVGSSPVVVADKSGLPALNQALADRADATDTGETDIGTAIEHLLSTTSSSSLLLVSDGFETVGSARSAATAARSKGLKIFPLLPDHQLFHQGALSIASLQAPTTANAGDVVELRSSIRNSFDTEQSARFELWYGKKKLYANTVRILPNQEKLISVKTPPTEGGLHRLRAVLQPTAASESIEQHRWLSVKSKSKILLLSGNQDDRRVFGRLLNAKGYAVEDIVANGNTAIPTRFENYTSVVLNNVAKRQLPKEFLSSLESFVAKGGGLLLIGGDRSFGLGGYHKTVLEEMSPVTFVPPRTTKRRLNNAVILVLDKSRSMVFQNKIDAAKAAAITAIRALKNDDFVGVIGFDSAPFVIISLERVKDVKPIADRRMRNLTAAGKTNLLPALSAARRSLRKAKASRKHIIVLSDGKVPLVGNEYIEEIGRLRRDNISVSTVALGIEADVPFMKLVAQQGRGAFYHTLDPSRLPEIFLHDIKVTTGEQTLKEKKRYDIIDGPDGIVSTKLKHFPHIKGFVETLRKEAATTELVTNQAKRSFPVLASWDYQRGRVVAYTSDVNGRWSDPWVRWDEFPTFWGHVIEKLKSRSTEVTSEVDFDLRYSVEGEAVVLDLAVFDDALRVRAAPSVSADVIQPGGEKKTIAFEPTAPGRFLARIENGRPGDYRLTTAYGKVSLPPLAITLGGELFGEKPGGGVDVQTLSDIAYLSGGEINPTPAALSGHRRRLEQINHLFPPLVALAFCLILLEAFIREWGLGLLSLLPRRRKTTVSKPQKASSKKLAA